MGRVIVQSTADTKGVLISDYATDYIFRGKTFSSKTIHADLPTGLSYFLFRTGDKPTIVRPPTFVVTDGPVLVSFRVGSDYTGGTNMGIYNRNTMSSITTSTVMTSGPTGADEGVILTQLLIGSSSDHPAESGGGVYSDDDLFMVGPNTSILLETDNVSGGVLSYFGVSITFYED